MPTGTSVDYPAHPIAEAFPLLTGAEFADLVDSMRRHGFRPERPCLRWTDADGKTWLIDGRNRTRAARTAGVEPIYRDWDGRGSLVELIVDLNIRLRRLAVHQLAEVGLKLLPFYEREARERQEAGKTLDATASKGRAVDQLGKKLGVSGESIQRAKRLKKQGTRKLRRAVQEGVVSLASAADIAQLPAEQQVQRLNEARRRAEERRQGDHRADLLERAGKHLDKLRRVLDQLTIGSRALKAADVIAEELERLQS